MIDFSSWELRKLSIDGLLLDKRNPRLPEDMLNESQTNILHYLVNEFNVLDIAQNIVQNGFFINETPIVSKEGRSFFVIEGNRRVAALKLLRNPDLAPPRKKHTYARLAENVDTTQWEKMPVYIAPSREEAAPILLARHASEMTARWLRIMKMRFLAGDVLKGIPHEVLADRFSISVAEVRTAAITILLREMIRESAISQKKKDRYLSEKFQTSTLSRYIETRKFSELSGLQLVGAALQFEIPTDDFLAVLICLCEEIVEGKITPHTHGDADDRGKYLAKVFHDVTTGKQQKNEFKASPPKEDGSKADRRKPKPKKIQERLIVDTRAYYTGVPKLDEMIAEGQKMMVTSYPHAGGLLLRTILDLGITRLYDINGKKDEAYNTKGRSLGLTERIQGIYKRHPDWLPSHAICDKLKRFAASDSEAFVHIETLNDYAHGYKGKPTKDDLRNFWEQIDIILDQIMEEGD